MGREPCQRSGCHGTSENHPRGHDSDNSLLGSTVGLRHLRCRIAAGVDLDRRQDLLLEGGLLQMDGEVV